METSQFRHDPWLRISRAKTYFNLGPSASILTDDLNRVRCRLQMKFKPGLKYRMNGLCTLLNRHRPPTKSIVEHGCHRLGMVSRREAALKTLREMRQQDFRKRKARNGRALTPGVIEATFQRRSKNWKPAGIQGVYKKKYTEGESNPCRLLGRQA